MPISYQRLASLVKKNINSGTPPEKLATLFYSMENRIFDKKNLSEKFAYRFLYAIKTQNKKIHKQQALYTKSTWRQLYKKLHYLGQKEQLTDNSFFKEYLISLNKDSKNIAKFCPATRSYILLNLWYSKQDNFYCLQQNYQFLKKLLPQASCQFKKMKSILIWKKQALKTEYLFHHGLGSLAPNKFRKLALACIEGKKIAASVLVEKKFICFCRTTDGYRAHSAKGIFIDLQPLLREVVQKYFLHQTSLPAICWSKQFSCKRLAAYNFVEDQIYISKIFDFPHKNLEILHYLIFHEMLHKDLGMRRKGGRIYTHTSEFKKKEQAYPRFLEIQKKLDNYTAMSKP